MRDLTKILQDRQCFKLVCGAGNENVEQVKRLVYIYALAGATIFDLSANEEVVKVAEESLSLAQSDAYLCVSVGIAGDPHIQKANIITANCCGCRLCIKSCSQDAITIKDQYAFVESYKCIGCGRCENVCQNKAIVMQQNRKDLKEILAPLSKYNISIYELHAIGDDDKVALHDWQIICQQPSPFKSLCIDRSCLGNKRLIQRIKDCLAVREDYTTILQTDGTPMSGGVDDYKSTLQAIATAELVSHYHLPAYILLSGGTNSKSRQLANMVDVPINGVAIGSFARKIIKELIDMPDFWDRQDIIALAVAKAKMLVDTVVAGE